MSESIVNILKDYFSTQPVSRAYLFGSYSKDEQTPNSDIDLLVCFDDVKKISLMNLSKMSIDLELLLGHDVDLVPDGSLKTYAEETVNRDKILIYERAR